MLRNKYSPLRNLCTPLRVWLLLLLCMHITMLHGARVTDQFHINGYSSFEFQYLLTDGDGDKNASFDADLFDLVFNFFPVERLRIATDITFEHGVSTESERGNVAIEYAFPEFILRDWLKFRAGKMFCNFGIYNEIHTAKPAFMTVKEPFSTNKNDKFGSEYRFFPRWIVGIAALGDIGLKTCNIDYIIQISNGGQKGGNPFEEDNNLQKAVGGRLRLMAENGVGAGVSFYADWLQPNERGGSTRSLFSGGGHLQWEVGSATVEVEVIGGKVEAIKRVGFTALTSYDFGLHKIPGLGLDLGFEPYFRYEYLKPNLSIPHNGAQLFVYGIRIAFTPVSSVKFDFNTMKVDTNNAIYDRVAVQTELKAALVVGF